MRGEASRAAELTIEALSIYRDIDHRGGVADTLATGAEVAQAQGMPVVAARLLAAADAQRTEIAFVPPPFQQDEENAILAWCKQELGAEGFDVAANEGKAASMEELVGTIEGLASSNAATPATAGPAQAGLTPREVEIARLLAEGLSNQQIADALSISLRTAQTHVANILNKLGLSSRAAVAAHAVRHGIV
ncbi:MAG: helix-turn-helix domain-containing protein [Thermomicrobiales bacterium]